MLALSLLVACLDCTRAPDVDVEATNAAGDRVVIEAATLTLEDGSTVAMSCSPGDPASGNSCTFDLEEGAGEPLSVVVTVSGVEFTSTEFSFDEPAECGMTPGWDATVVLPDEPV